MESSYRIIKNNSIESSDDSFIIDTDTDTDYINQMIESYENQEEKTLEEDITDEKKLEILTSIDDYKKKVNKEIEAEKKNILEMGRIQAQQDAIEIRERARKEGYDKGYNKGYNTAYDKAMEDVKKEAEDIKGNALDILKEVKEYRDNYLRENKENIYILAKTMVENIIDYLIDLEDENIILLIKPLLLEYIREEDIIISSNFEGKSLLEKHRDKLKKIAPDTRFIFLEDKAIDKNGFIIENDESIVDLQIKTQIENMFKEISDIDG